MNELYVAHTPYHILISCGIASLNSKDKYLIITYDFPQAEIFKESIINWDSNPFKKVILIPGTVSVANKNFFSLTKLHYNNSFKLKDIYLKYCSKDVCSIYLFNDRRPEVQYISHINSVEKGFNIFVEDGLVVYSNYIAKKSNIILYFLLKLVYGVHYEPNNILGSSKFIDKLMVFMPKYIRPTLQNKSVDQIPFSIFNKLNTELIPLIFTKYASKNHFGYDCLLVVDHSDLFKGSIIDSYIKIYSEIIALLSTRYSKLGIKYHPREEKGDFLKIRMSNKCEILPQSLPMELIYLDNVHNPPKLVISNISTALMTCNIIFKGNVSIVSTTKIFGFNGDPRLLSMFRDFGVIIPDSFSEFHEVLESVL